MPPINRMCNLCHGPADMLCQRCRDPYCSAYCQQTDWPQHKLHCIPMPMLMKASMGAGQFARPEPGNNGNNARVSTASNLDMKFEVSNPSYVEMNRLLRTSGTRNGNGYPPVENSTINDKADGNNLSKPSYPKSVQVDAASMRRPIPTADQLRRPGQVITKQITNEPKPVTTPIAIEQREIPKPIAIEQKEIPKPKAIEPKEIPKPIAIETKAIPKPVAIEPKEIPKPIAIEPKEIPKPVAIVPKEVPKPVAIEPKEVPKPVAIVQKEVPKPIIIEPKQDPVKNVPPTPVEPVVTPQLEEKNATSEAEKMVKPNIAQLEVDVSKKEKWMIPFPMPKNEFVPVVVQFVSADKTVWVSALSNDAACNNLLRQIHKSVGTATTPKPHDIKVNGLYTVPLEEIHYRGIVLEPVSKDDTVYVRLIDYGNDIVVPIGELKMPIPAMTDLNAFAFPIKFRNPRKVEVFDEIKIKSEMIKDDVMTVIVEGENSLLTMKDIEIVPIPIDATKNLYCLDFSNILNGYISACVYDQKAIQSVDVIGAKMTEYCKQSKEDYSPQVDELCLVLFEDGQWYRAVTLKVVDEKTFSIMFIDYGNIITVNSSSVRKMPDEFLHCCLMNKCNIKDFPKKPTKSEFQAKAIFFNDNQIFNVKTVEMDKNGEYVIDPVI